MFGYNKSSKNIVKALHLLSEYGLVKSEIRRSKTRPIEVWVSTEK
jgi:hypothetical protein